MSFRESLWLPRMSRSPKGNLLGLRLIAALGVVVLGAGQSSGQLPPLLSNLQQIAELGKQSFEQGTGMPASVVTQGAQKLAENPVGTINNALVAVTPSKEELEKQRHENIKMISEGKAAEKRAQEAQAAQDKADAEQAARDDAAAKKEDARQARIQAEKDRLAQDGKSLFNENWRSPEEILADSRADAALKDPANWLAHEAQLDSIADKPLKPAEDPEPGKEPTPPAPTPPASTAPAPAAPATDPDQEMQDLIQQLIDAANAKKRHDIEQALKDAVEAATPPEKPAETPPPPPPPPEKPPVNPPAGSGEPPTDAEKDAAVDLIMQLLADDLPADNEPRKPEHITRLQTISTDQMAELREKARQNGIDAETRRQAAAIKAQLDKDEADREAAKRRRFEEGTAQALRGASQPLQLPTYDDYRRNPNVGRNWDPQRAYQRSQNMGRAIQYGLGVARSFGAFGGGGGGHHGGGLINGS